MRTARLIQIALWILVLLLTANFTFANVIHVPQDRPTIQAAIDSSSNGDVVLVAPGTYLENIDFHGKAITVTTLGNAATTIIDGQQRGPVVTFVNGETVASAISGFTLRNGLAEEGGGVFVSGASPTISGNIISNNRAQSDGGGIGVGFGSPAILNNTISNNTAPLQGLGGGGISIRGVSSSSIKGNTITNNSTFSQGGGIALWSGNAVTIANNVISGNTAYNYGGGISMLNDASWVTIGQNIITGNSALSGHAVYWSNPPAFLVGNTITDGTGVLGGSTVTGENFPEYLKVANNIIVANAGAEHAFECEAQGFFAIFKNNDIFSTRGASYGGSCSDQTGFNGNISTDPKFVAGGYALQPGSPAIDAGNSSGVNLFSADFADSPRIVNGSGGTGAVIDMGAYEYMPSALQFVPMTPCRVVDTRRPDGPFGGPRLSGGEVREFVLPNNTNCVIPTTAIAYSLNATAAPTRPLGYLTLWPSGPLQPGVSTLNSPDGRVKANAAITLAGNYGAVKVYVTHDTQFVLDIDGYFVPAGSQTYQFYPLAPCRVIDTRESDGHLGGPFLAGGTARDFPVRESNCIPPAVDIKAYSMNFTVTPHVSGQPLGYLTVWPAGSDQPVVSTLNNPTATTVANAAIVPAGSGGDIQAYVSGDSHLIADINGYFAAPGAGGASYCPATPCRVYDSRTGQGAFQGARAVDVVDSLCAPPSNANAYVFNATVVPANGPMGYLTLWPDGQDQPTVSTLNARDGFITSNMAIVPNGNGSIDAYASGITQLILDISGYFAP